MEKRFVVKLENALNEARSFFEDNFHIVNNDEQICGFPETKGKERITEWGATSAGLAALALLGTSSDAFRNQYNSAKIWLKSQQHSNGCWEASGVCSSEPTAGVLIDFITMNANTKVQTDKALNFLKSCYKNEGYYVSIPSSLEIPHIYTTFIVTKCLSKLSSFEHRDEIRQWILSSNTLNNRWGKTPKSNVEIFVHTVFALFILHYCGSSWQEIKSTYKKQINWLIRNIHNLDYTYEEIEIIQANNDQYGREYYRLRLRHFALPLIGHLFREIGNEVHVLRVAQKMISQQFTGGWGPSKDGLTIWASHQAVEYLSSIKSYLMPSLSEFKYLCLSFISIPFVITKIILSILMLMIIVITSFIPSYQPAIVVALISLCFTWLFKRD